MSDRDRKPEPADAAAAKTPPPTKDDTTDDAADAIPPNPPHTTVGSWFTAPKFGSAGSGGLEIEPGPERD